MALPAGYFKRDASSLIGEGTISDTIPDITKEINLGNLDLEEFLKDKSEENLPVVTMSPAPKIQQPAQSQAKEVEPQNKKIQEDDVNKLEEIERILLGLDEKINSLNVTEEEPKAEPRQPTAAELLELKLNENSEDVANIVEPVRPPTQNIFNNTNVIDNRTSNQEKIKEFLEQKEIYLKQREDIIKNYNNNISNVSNISNLENTDDISSSTLNQNFEGDVSSPLNLKTESTNNTTTPTNILNREEIQNQILNQQINNESLPNEISTITSEQSELAPAIDREGDALQAENILQKTDITVENPSIIEKNEPVMEQEPVFLEKGGIVTEPTNAVIGEGEKPEAVIPLEEVDLEKAMSSSIASGGPALPSGDNEMSGHASEIIAILKSLEGAVKGLGESLGSKFSGLTDSMKSIKSSVVNNSYNSSSNSESSSMNSKQNSQRGTVPDYVGDYPDPGDFPKGFDVTKLGGVNLPNPQSIL